MRTPARRPVRHSMVQALTIDETAKIAPTFAFHDVTPGYSFFGGNTEVLGIRNVEIDLAGLSTTVYPAAVYEVTPTAPAQTVWQMNISGYTGWLIALFAFPASTQVCNGKPSA